MSEYIYSPTQNMICACALKSDYLLAGTWPADALPLEASTARKFMNEAPAGKKMVAGIDGFPVWESLPPPTPEELIEQAERTKNQLLKDAQQEIGIWQTKLLLGHISDGEKKALNKWLDYIDAVQAVNVNITSEIVWPTKSQFFIE